MITGLDGTYINLLLNQTIPSRFDIGSLHPESLERWLRQGYGKGPPPVERLLGIYMLCHQELELARTYFKRAGESEATRAIRRNMLDFITKMKVEN